MSRNQLVTAVGLVIVVVAAVVVGWLSRSRVVPSTPESSQQAGSAVATSSQQATRKTEVVTVVGVDRDANPAPGFTVDQADTEVENCIASPAGGDNVASCSPSAAGADVCWIGTDRKNLLCGTSPWEKKLVRMVSAERIEPLTAQDDPEPWGLVLADGARCQLRNGGAWGGRADGYAGAYFCDRGESEFVLAGPDAPAVNRSAPLWTVHVGPLGSEDEQFPAPEVVAVSTAYFAGTP